MSSLMHMPLVKCSALWHSRWCHRDSQYRDLLPVALDMLLHEYGCSWRVAATGGVVGPRQGSLGMYETDDECEPHNHHQGSGVG
jgi:hypothetical protein